MLTGMGGPSEPLTKKQIRRNIILLVVGAVLFAGVLVWANGQVEYVTGSVIETRISTETRSHVIRPIACMLRVRVDAGVVRFMFLRSGVKECSLLREGDVVRLSIDQVAEQFRWLEIEHPGIYTGRLEP